MRLLVGFLIGGLMIIACGSGKPAMNIAALPHVRIYKTRADYCNNVAVTMNSERTQIVSYPDPTDIRPSMSPVPLGDGWYLDRRGISANTVFTDYTWEQYAALRQMPSRDTLMKHIIDKQPLTALWDCGVQEPTPERLKEIIKNGFRGCTPLYITPPRLE